MNVNYMTNGDVMCDGVYIGRIDSDGDWDGEGWTEEQIARELAQQLSDGLTNGWYPQLDHWKLLGKYDFFKIHS